MSISTVMPTYARTNLVFESGDGSWLTTQDGRQFLDFGSGIAVTALGHTHPRLLEALTIQAKKLWHCSNLYRIQGQEQLADRLVSATFAETVFFCNSGAEAVECSIKMARRFHQGSGKSARSQIITATGAFHGRTLATISAGGNKNHLDGFGPAVEGFRHVAFGDLGEARAAVSDQTAAVLVEPVQGESGIQPADYDYLRGLRDMTNEHGLLLIFDEVQCGMGRTGKLFAHEWAGVEPDIMSAAKALGGGFPIGACLATGKAATNMVAGTHGSTFGGNPLGCAVANVVLDVILEEGFLDRVNEIGEKLMAASVDLVARHPSVFETVRGKGLMIGLKCKIPNTDVIECLMGNGMLTVVGGDNVVRLLPALTIGEKEINAALKILEQSAAQLEM